MLWGNFSSRHADIKSIRGQILRVDRIQTGGVKRKRVGGIAITKRLHARLLWRIGRVSTRLFPFHISLSNAFHIPHPPCQITI